MNMMLIQLPLVLILCYGIETALNQEQDFTFDVQAIINFGSVEAQYYQLFASDLSIIEIQTVAYEQFSYYQQQGILPLNNPPDNVSGINFRNALCDSLIRFNLYLPEAKLGDLIRPGRGVVSGELSLDDYLQQLQFDEPLTSNNTLDNVEYFMTVYMNLVEAQNVNPKSFFNTPPEDIQQIQVEFSDAVRQFAQLSNNDDLIRNSESLNMYEVAFTWVNMFQTLTTGIETDTVLEMMDYCLNLLDNAYDYDERLSSVPDYE